MGGTGLLTLTGSNAYSGTTTVSGGTLQFNGATSSVSGNFSNLATLAFTQGANSSLSGNISGSGSLVQSGKEVLTLTGSNSYTGGTTISAGKLEIGNGGTTGSIVGNVSNSGALEFDRSDTVVFGGAIRGTGSLDQLGNGTLVLTGSNSYTGGTTIDAGVLRIGNGGSGLTGNVSFYNSTTLVFSRSGNLVFGGTITDGDAGQGYSGFLVQLGSGQRDANGKQHLRLQ